MKLEEKLKVKRLIELYITATKMEECDYRFDKDYLNKVYNEIDKIENELKIYGNPLKSDKELIQDKITQTINYISKVKKENDTSEIQRADNLLTCLVNEYERADN